LEYRKLGQTGKALSLLSFGGMRIPRVSVKKAIEVLTEAYRLGINYFETSPGYGNSEHKIGLAIKEMDRSKIYISTKAHPGNDPSAYAIRSRLDTSLKKLGLDSVDFFQIWGINTEEHFETVFKKEGALAGVREAQKEGLIQHVGFTTHATSSLIIKLLETREFESVTLLYHLMNRVNEPVLAKAEELKIGTIIITPLSQGLLAHPTSSMQEDFKPYPVRDYSLKWLADDHRITSITSGMKTMKELTTNYQSIEDFSPLTSSQKEVGKSLYKKLAHRVGKNYCTECKACLPCPKQIDIPELMRLNNLMRGYQAEYYCKQRYKFVGNGGTWYPGEKATQCNDCGDCELRCPEHLSIVMILKQLHNELYTGEVGRLSTI